MRDKSNIISTARDAIPVIIISSFVKTALSNSMTVNPKTVVIASILLLTIAHPRIACLRVARDLVRCPEDVHQKSFISCISSFYRNPYLRMIVTSFSAHIA
jgi:hypothetical protein